MSDSTITVSGVDAGAGARAAEEVLALVIAWSAAEPGRVGEVAFVEDSAIGVLGRGEAPEGEAGWLRFVRQRPGSVERTGPVAGPGISRRQLRVQARGGALLVKRLGRCPTLVGGQEVDQGVLAPGETLLLKSQLLLLCARRPRQMPPLRDFPADRLGAFGAPDAFGILGESPAAHRLRDGIAFAAKARAGVLVTGASGTGKELCARAVHALSRRGAAAFVARNAATLPAGLVDAELFGHARGYPNAGTPERPGLIGQADGGTLFLDEIGELSHDLQAHLLRVLDAGEYHRLGEASARRADLRLVAATNRAPEALKHDFLARLSLRVALPGLDERREDVPLLVRHLLRRAGAESPDLVQRFFEGDEPRLDAALVEHLLRRAYTTHVRELDALLWRAMSASTGDRVAFSEALRDGAPASSEPTEEAIRAAVKRHGKNLSKAAQALGMPSRYALYRMLKRRGIALDGLRDDEGEGA